jgi:hypothetical protein
MAMKNPPHPGLSIRRDCLEPLGLSVTKAASRLGITAVRYRERSFRHFCRDGNPTRYGIWR